MYCPAAFAMTDAQVAAALVTQHPLATLVYPTADGLAAEHLPLQLLIAEDGRWRLVGHMAKANPLWRQLPASLLVIFQGPDHYISPSAYPSKAVDGKAVPTWNYVAVHCHGTARALTDAEQLIPLLAALTAQHEAGREAPWQLDEAPAGYIEQLVGAIVGIEIDVSHWQGKAKVSQNQSEANRQGVVQLLTAEAAASKATTMAAWVTHRGKGSA